MFSVDTQTVYHTHKPSQAVYHSSTDGQWSTNTLDIYGGKINEEDSKRSTNNDEIYPVRPDEQGNDPLTGVKARNEKCWFRFTVAELEVFSVKLIFCVFILTYTRTIYHLRSLYTWY